MSELTICKCTCVDIGPMGRMTIVVVRDVVRVRHEYVCRRHSPVPLIETDHTVDGAERFALDLLRAVKAIREARALAAKDRA